MSHHMLGTVSEAVAWVEKTGRCGNFSANRVPGRGNSQGKGPGARRPAWLGPPAVATGSRRAGF